MSQVQSSLFQRPDTVCHPLYVIVPIFNPQRYRARWKLYKSFERYILSNNEAHLVTIECTFGERCKAITEQKSPKHTVIHVQSESEIWIKENLINLAIQRLPEDWKYVAWIDGDVQFARPDWVGETIQQLQHYQIVQMFSEAVDLSPNFEVMKRFKGFGYCYHHEEPQPCIDYYSGHNGTSHWHPGFAWAARREAINHLGGLIEWSILGSGDTLMAQALIGNLNASMIKEVLGEGGVEWLDEWQKRAVKYIKKNVGYVQGLLLHYWHGKKANRGYKSRRRILVDNKFDPKLDLKKDWQGLYQLTDRSNEMRDEMRAYFRKRNEDSIDI